MIPRIQGKVGQAFEPEEMKGKWFFEIWITALGQGDEKRSMGTFGPWDSEEIAGAELRKACKLLCEDFEKQVDGKATGKYIDMKDNKLKAWDETEEKKPRERKSTMIHLVAELEKISPRTPAIQEMIEEAKAGEYHDYKNQKYACGKMESAGRLRNLGYPALARRIEDGEFDEEADETDKAEMRKTLPKAAWKIMGL